MFLLFPTIVHFLWMNDMLMIFRVRLVCWDLDSIPIESGVAFLIPCHPSVCSCLIHWLSMCIMSPNLVFFFHKKVDSSNFMIDISRILRFQFIRPEWRFDTCSFMFVGESNGELIFVLFYIGVWQELVGKEIIWGLLLMVADAIHVW